MGSAARDALTALSAAAALVGGACRGPGLPPVPAPERAVFRAPAPVAAAPRVERPEPPAAPAPAAAGAMSLERIVNRALEANRGLLGARDGVSAAGYSLAAARAPFELRVFPTAVATVAGTDGEGTDAFGLGVAVERVFETGTVLGVAPDVRSFEGDYTAEVSTSIRQPLLRGLDREFVLASVDAAEFSARTARRSLHLARVDTVVSTVSAAYQVVRQRELLRLNEDSVQRLSGHAEAARARERAGLAGSLDVYRATLQYNRSLDDVENAREAHAEALDTLRIQLALDLAAPLAVEAPLAYEWVELGEAEAVELALANRVELRQAEDTFRDARRRSRVAHHGTRPDLDLLFTWSRFGTGGELDRSLDLDDSAFSVSLITTSDLARTQEFARYGQSLIDVRAAERSLDFQRDQVVRQVRRELRDLDRARKRILLQEEQIGQAEGKLELARVKFNRGLASNFDVVEAEGELRSAQTSLVSAVIDYIVGTYRLRAVLGTLLEVPEPEPLEALE